MQLLKSRVPLIYDSPSRHKLHDTASCIDTQVYGCGDSGENLFVSCRNGGDKTPLFHRRFRKIKVIRFRYTEYSHTVHFSESGFSQPFTIYFPLFHSIHSNNSSNSIYIEKNADLLRENLFKGFQQNLRPFRSLRISVPPCRSDGIKSPNTFL